MSKKVSKALDEIIKAFRGYEYSIKIGILSGNKNTRRGEGSDTNAEIGAKHEFGWDELPRRSFLRLPLSSWYFRHKLDEAGFFSGIVKEIKDEKDVKPLLRKVALVAEATVDEAFHTGGFGQWKPSNMTFKKVHQTLVETGQLRKSITSQVVKKK